MDRIIVVQTDAGDVEELYLIKNYDGECMKCFHNAERDYFEECQKQREDRKHNTLQSAINSKLTLAGYNYSKLMNGVGYNIYHAERG